MNGEIYLTFDDLKIKQILMKLRILMKTKKPQGKKKQQQILLLQFLSTQISTAVSFCSRQAKQAAENINPNKE